MNESETMTDSSDLLQKAEQLRAIENGYSILVGKVKHTCDGIDTPEQYTNFVKRYLSRRSKVKN